MAVRDPQNHNCRDRSLDFPMGKNCGPPKEPIAAALEPTFPGYIPEDWTTVSKAVAMTVELSAAIRAILDRQTVPNHHDQNHSLQQPVHLASVDLAVQSCPLR